MPSDLFSQSNVRRLEAAGWQYHEPSQRWWSPARDNFLIEGEAVAKLDAQEQAKQLNGESA